MQLHFVGQGGLLRRIVHPVRRWTRPVDLLQQTRELVDRIFDITRRDQIRGFRGAIRKRVALALVGRNAQAVSYFLPQSDSAARATRSPRRSSPIKPRATKVCSVWAMHVTYFPWFFQGML